jgi:hypothetical protein
MLTLQSHISSLPVPLWLKKPRRHTLGYCAARRKSPLITNEIHANPQKTCQFHPESTRRLGGQTKDRRNKTPTPQHPPICVPTRPKS